jgi:hypothetical protein
MRALAVESCARRFGALTLDCRDLSFEALESLIAALPPDRLVGDPPLVGAGLVGAGQERLTPSAEIFRIETGASYETWWRCGVDVLTGKTLSWKAEIFYCVDAGVWTCTLTLLDGARAHCVLHASIFAGDRLLGRARLTTSEVYDGSSGSASVHSGAPKAHLPGISLLFGARLAPRPDASNSNQVAQLSLDLLTPGQPLVLQFRQEFPRSTLQIDALAAWACARERGAQRFEPGRGRHASVHTPAGLCALAAHLETTRYGVTSARVADVSRLDAIMMRHLALHLDAIVSSVQTLSLLPVSLCLRLHAWHGLNVKGGQVLRDRAIGARILSASDEDAVQLLEAFSLKSLSFGQLRSLLRPGGGLSVARERKPVRAALVSGITHRITDSAELPPPELICPISYNMLDDAVLLAGDGHTYSRAQITRWLSQNNTSPLTNKRLSGGELALFDNFAVKKLVASYRAQHPAEPCAGELRASKRHKRGASGEQGRGLGGAADGDDDEVGEQVGTASAAAAAEDRRLAAIELFESWAR